MNKRGAVGMSMESIIYMVLCVLFFVGALFFINGYNHGSAFYEDFYSKEIVNLINNAESGMELNIDVTKLAIIEK